MNPIMVVVQLMLLVIMNLTYIIHKYVTSIMMTIFNKNDEYSNKEYFQVFGNRLQICLSSGQCLL